MTKSLVRLTVLVFSVAFAPGTWAVESGLFPGLSNMIKYSQAIVVVTILSEPETRRTHSENQWAVQRVKVLSVLKGPLREQEEIDVELMAGLLFPATTYLARDDSPDDFPVRERYVLFLASDYFFPGHKYSIVNNQGSVFWIPRSADLSGLAAGDVRGNIELLVNATLAHAKSRAQTLDQCIQGYLSGAQDLPPSHIMVNTCRK